MTQYFREFSGSSTGTSPPTGFTEYGDTANSEWGVVDEDSVRSVYATATTNAYRVLGWTDGAGPGSVSGDVDILVFLETGASVGGHHIGVAMQFDTGAGDYHFVKMADFGTPFVGVDEIEAYAFVDGDFTNQSFSAATRYWLRARRTGDDIMVRIWTGAVGDEPGTWQHTRDVSGSGVGTAGHVGFAFQNSLGTRIWAQIGVGTGGDSAPSSAPASGPAIPIVMHHRRMMDR